MNELVGPPNPVICTIGVADNSSFLTQTKSGPVQEPLSGSTMGVLMVLSVFQYQPITNPTYSNAIGQASRAAFVQVGGQALQNQLTSKAEGIAKDTIHSFGITDTEIVAVLGATKTIRDRSISLDGPKIESLKTHFTAGQNNASIGLGWNFK